MIRKVYQGDCTSLSEKIEDGTVDFLFTDSPYNIPEGIPKHIRRKTFGEALSNKNNIDVTFWLKFFLPKLKKDSHFINFIHWIDATTWVTALKAQGLSIRNYIIWDKRDNVTLLENNETNLSFADFREVMIWASKGEPTINQTEKLHDFLMGVMTYPATYTEPLLDLLKEKGFTKDFHPFRKNPYLISDIIEILTNEGDMVLDPFCGSGVVLECSKKLNRAYVGIELNSNSYENTTNQLKE